MKTDQAIVCPLESVAQNEVFCVNFHRPISDLWLIWRLIPQQCVHLAGFCHGYRNSTLANYVFSGFKSDRNNELGKCSTQMKSCGIRADGESCILHLRPFNCSGRQFTPFKASKVGNPLKICSRPNIIACCLVVNHSTRGKGGFYCSIFSFLWTVHFPADKEAAHFPSARSKV